MSRRVWRMIHVWELSGVLHKAVSIDVVQYCCKGSDIKYQEEEVVAK